MDLWEFRKEMDKGLVEGITEKVTALITERENKIVADWKRYATDCVAFERERCAILVQREVAEVCRMIWGGAHESMILDAVAAIPDKVRKEP